MSKGFHKLSKTSLQIVNPVIEETYVGYKFVYLVLAEGEIDKRRKKMAHIVSMFPNDVKEGYENGLSRHGVFSKNRGVVLR